MNLLQCMLCSFHGVLYGTVLWEISSRIIMLLYHYYFFWDIAFVRIDCLVSLLVVRCLILWIAHQSNKGTSIPGRRV